MAEDTLKWTFGLINSANKYLTAETFQAKVTCNGATLKKKQIWTMEKTDGDEFALKASTRKYLTSDKDGKVDASGEEIGPDQKFVFESQPDGRVALRSVAHNRYLGGSGDQISGFDQSVGPTNVFTIHLAIHPQVNIRNVNRKTYMHLVEDEKVTELACNEEVPWGYDATIILEFHEGKYALRASNTLYLSRTGSLEEDITKDCLFQLIFKGSQVAFMDCNQKYLTAVGKSATVQSRKGTIGKDELFELMDSRPQVQLIASNGKYLSVREGIEVRAKQADVTDKEIFQMEPVDLTDFSGNVKWRFRSYNKKVWNCGTGASISCVDAEPLPDTTEFSIVWMGPMIAIKASNGKFISIKPNGQMTANVAEADVKDNDNCKFVFEFINRPILVLRGEYGFVGARGSSGILDCNRSQYDVFGVVGSAGTYQIKGANGKFFKIESDASVSINGDSPTDFYLELRAPSRMAIISSKDGKLLKGQQNGGFTATGDGIATNTLWEY